MNSATSQHLPLGQALITAGLLSDDQLHIALREQQERKQQLGRLLVTLGFLTEKHLCETLAAIQGKTKIDLANISIDPEALKLIPGDLARRQRVLPLDFDQARRHLLLAVADSHDLLAQDQIQAELGSDFKIEMRLAGESEISQAIDRFYGHDFSIDGILHELATGEIDRKQLSTATPDFGHPIVRLIDSLLNDAVKRTASDIHFEPEAHFLRIRYRIDGALRQIRALHKSCWPAMMVRLKVMAGMNITETRAPQDGRISLNISGRPVDFRTACQPTIHGENMVMRILDRRRGIVPLEDLGLRTHHLAQLKRMIARPEGVILVTGPTGSGKTTTLYSILGQINHEGVNIMTLEDPVEYQLPMVRQTSLGESSKLDFASGIRSMMRQDPDVILVGEIRDPETAEMTFRAAMTGHQVFSTLHSNSAIGAIPRLLDIGVQPDMMSGNIIGIIAQRLVRRLCQTCRQPRIATSEELKLLDRDTAAPTNLTIYHPQGCPACEHQGYRGRIALIETLRIGPGLDKLIAQRSTLVALREQMHEEGFQTLADDGVQHVIEGNTSLEELCRIVDLSERM